MKYTLYIDESGDFVSNKGQWLISGVLFSSSYENCENFLKTTMKDVPKELGLHSIKDFHLTEFRKYGNEKVVNIAKTVLDKLENLPFNYHFLVAINYTKSSLSSREKTYRLMLADLLALCETVLDENEVIEKLDLVVATRTIDGVLATTISNINEEIIKSLPVALEVDLATKGMVELIGKHINVKMDYANNSWGLVCADFIANLNYHNRKKYEKSYLVELSEKGKFSLFESFGGYEVRKANIAERDKDYVLALYRWIVICAKKDNPDDTLYHIESLLHRVFTQRGTVGQNATIEALIERLWRNYNDVSQYKFLSKMLDLFEQELEKYLNNYNLIKFQNLLFRLRNIMILVANHLGDTEKVILLVQKQSKKIQNLASNPENFQMILDFKSYEIELSVNLLDLEKALKQAVQYNTLIENYKELWKLLMENDNISGFDYSRANIKAKMSLIRCEILSNQLYDVESFNQKLNNITYIENLLSNKIDIGRLNNYKIMFYLKQKLSRSAVDFCLSIHKNMQYEQLNEFDLLWFLHSLNDTLLNNQNIDIKVLKVSIDFQIKSLDPNKKGHPMDLLWREIALFQFLIGEKSNAMKSIRKSKNVFDLIDSPIARWLNLVLKIHSDYINNTFGTLKDYVAIEENLPLLQTLDSDTFSLEQVRLISPY